MDAERNLLSGVLALQTGLIDAQQFLEVFKLWSAAKDGTFVDLLIERGWLRPADRLHLDYLVNRKTAARANLSTVGEGVKDPPTPREDVDIPSAADEFAQDEQSVTTETLAYGPEVPKRYSIWRLHATGGIGHVWLAHDGHLGRDVALKELRPEQAGNPNARARFLKEAQITGQLEHPGIVPVYELAGESNAKQPFYTMRFVKGQTLSAAARTYQQRRVAGQADALELLSLLNALVVVANTVAYAHSRGILHRDLKGQNVVLGQFGEVVVLDWGLAKLMAEPDNAVTPAALAADLQAKGSPDLTVQGQALGTPAYMAPEQAAGRLDLLDCRTDVYGLGAILYEILTGKPPFTGTNTQEVLAKVITEEPQPPRQLWPEVPPSLEAICLRALSKQPAQRHASASELAQDVQHWQEVRRQQAEEALRHSEALHRSLMESLPLAVWRKDLEGRFTFVNRQFLLIVGKPVEEILGKTDLDLYPAQLATKYRQDDAWVHQTGNTFETKQEFVTPEGVKNYIQVIKIPICDSRGKVIGTQGIAWDISERKRLEEALRRTETSLAQALKKLQLTEDQL
jgi:eukaryotic-like serine/threonine-protein kinase